MSLQKYSNLTIDLDQNPLFLISDLHAGAHNPNLEFLTRKKLETLTRIVHQENGQLIILGDLFDYWHESNNESPPCLSDWTLFLKQLHTFRRPTILLTGNHDHWASTKMSELGFILVQDSIILHSSHSKWFLIHGDGLPDDQGQLIRSGFNKIFRDPTVNKYFDHLPFRLRVYLMKSFSQYRRYRIEADDNHFQDSHYIENWLKKSPFNGLVFGHTHQAYYKEIDRQFLVNLGTFYSDSLVMTIQSKSHKVSTLDELINNYRSTVSI